MAKYLNKIFYDANKFISTQRKDYLISILVGIERLQNLNELKNAFNNVNVQTSIFTMREIFKDDQDLIKRFFILMKKYRSIRKRKINITTENVEQVFYPKMLAAGELSNISRKIGNENNTNEFKDCLQRKSNFIPSHLTEKKILEYEDDSVPSLKEFLNDTNHLLEIINKIIN